MERSGTWRWCGSHTQEDLREGEALLEITTDRGVTQFYWVYHGLRETRIMKMKMGTKTVYALNLKTGWCECPDHEKRQITCKHVKALRKALA